MKKWVKKMLNKKVIERLREELSEKELAIVLKKEQIEDLLLDIQDPLIDRFFDAESDALLDRKIEVLRAMKEGKTIAEIPDFYSILEFYPVDNVNKAGDKIETHWDF